MFTDRDRQKCDQLYDRYYSGRKFSRTLYQELIRKYVAPGPWVLSLEPEEASVLSRG